MGFPVLGASVGATGAGTIGPGLVMTGIPSTVAHGSHGFTGWHWHGSQTCTGGQIGAGWQGCTIAGTLSGCVTTGDGAHGWQGAAVLSGWVMIGAGVAHGAAAGGMT
jgi:hypothetical protein